MCPTVEQSDRQRYNRNLYCGIKDWKRGNITCKGPLKYKRVAARFAKKKNMPKQAVREYKIRKYGIATKGLMTCKSAKMPILGQPVKLKPLCVFGVYPFFF